MTSRTLQSAGIQPKGSPRLYELGTFYAALQFLGEVDEVGPSQLVFWELLMRRITCVVQVYGSATKKGEKADWSRADHWLGCPLLNGRCTMVGGEFRKRVANPTKEEALIDKEIRKANEKDWRALEVSVRLLLAKAPPRRSI